MCVCINLYALYCCVLYDCVRCGVVCVLWVCINLYALYCCVLYDCVRCGVVCVLWMCVRSMKVPSICVCASGVPDFVNVCALSMDVVCPSCLEARIVFAYF